MLVEELEVLLLELELEGRLAMAERNLFPMAEMPLCFSHAEPVAPLGSSLHLCSSV